MRLRRDNLKRAIEEIWDTKLRALALEKKVAVSILLPDDRATEFSWNAKFVENATNLLFLKKK